MTSTSEIHTQTRKADGVEIRYAEWNADAEPTLLLLSPWPESIYAWEQLWPRLTSVGHVLDNKTLESERALWKLSREAIARPTVKRVLEENAASSVLALLETTAEGRDFIAMLRVYLDEFGRQCGKPFHFSEPSWIEDPTPAVRTLQHDIGRVDRDVSGAWQQGRSCKRCV